MRISLTARGRVVMDWVALFAGTAAVYAPMALIINSWH